jgi:hypothetical protein
LAQRLKGSTVKSFLKRLHSEIAVDSDEVPVNWETSELQSYQDFSQQDTRFGPAK